MAPPEDRHRSYAAVRRGEAVEPATVVDNAPNPILVIDDGTIAFANAATERMLGYHPDDLVGAPVTRVLPDEFRDRLDEFLARPWDGGADTFEWRGRTTTAEGRRPTVTVSVGRHGPDSARVTAVVRSGSDGEDASRASTDLDPERYRTFVDRLANHAVALLDGDGHIRSWNTGAEALTGWQTEDAVGSHASMLCRDEWEGEELKTVDVERTLEHATAEGTVETRGWLTREDGSVYWGSVTITALHDAHESGRRYGVLVRDRTEQKRTAEERRLLVRLSREITEAGTFTEGVRLALEAVCERTRWTYAEAWAPPETTDPDETTDRQRLERVTSHAAAPSLEGFRAASEGWTFRANEGLPGRVWATGDPEWLPDTADVPSEVFNRAELAEEVGLGAALGVPITADDQVVAVLTFFLRERGEIDDQLAEIVTTVAAELGELVAHKQDEERLNRERTLLERVFETSPVGLLLLSNDGEVRRANDEATKIIGSSRAALTSHRFNDLPVDLYDRNGDQVADEDLPSRQVVATGDRLDGFEYRLENAAGDAVWVSMSAAPLRDDGEVEEVIVVIENITDAKERERSLRAYREAIEQAGHSIYFTDPDGAIEYVNPAFEEISGYGAEEVLGETPAVLSSGYHDDAFYEDLWETILDGEAWTGEVVNQRKDGERYVINQTIAPVTDDEGEIERFVAVNTDITERKRRQQELERQRDRLARLHHLVATMWDVTQALVAASTEPELAERVCEALVSTDFCEVAWIGTYDQRSETLVPTACAGIAEEELETVSIADEGSAASDVPCREAVRDREVVIAQPGSGRDLVAPWRSDDLHQGYHASAAIPLLDEELLYGTLNVYSNRPRAFDEDEREHLEGLGGAIAHGLDAVKTRKLLHTDQVVELEFRTRDDGAFLVDAAAAGDCTLSLAGTVPLSDERILLYVDLDNGSVEKLCELAEEREGIGEVHVLDEEGEGARLALTIRSNASPTKRLVDCGARVVDANAADGKASIVAHVTPDYDLRSIVEQVQAAFPDFELVSKREVERMQDLDCSELAELSDRQRASLYAAYHAGYFGWPRKSTAEEIASTMGVSGPTFHKHLRRAEQHILNGLLDADTSDRPSE